MEISKRIMLQYDSSSEQFQAYLDKALTVAESVRKIYRSSGLEGLPEKPISCLKLREKYKNITAGMGD